MPSGRQFQWMSQVFHPTSMSSGQLLTAQQDIPLESRTGSTLTRIVGTLTFSVQGTASTEVGYGVYMGQQRDLETTPDNVPDPVNSNGIDWLCWGVFAADLISTEHNVFNVSCDLRGQRKYRNKDSMIILVFSSATGSSLTTVSAALRIGVKLP